MSEAMSTTTDEPSANPLYDLTGFQRDLLVAITEVTDERSDYDAPSGQNIKDCAESFGYDTLNSGRLYPNLDTLVNKGLVERGTLDRRTNSYTLTDLGAEFLSEYREFVGGA